MNNNEDTNDISPSRGDYNLVEVESPKEFKVDVKFASIAQHYSTE